MELVWFPLGFLAGLLIGWVQNLSKERDLVRQLGSLRAELFARDLEMEKLRELAKGQVSESKSQLPYLVPEWMKAQARVNGWGWVMGEENPSTKRKSE